MVLFRLNIRLSDLKKSDYAAHDYVLKDLKNFFQKIKSIANNVNLSLLKDFLES